MSVVKTAMLLLLLVAIGANGDAVHEGCDDLEIIPKEDLNKVFGNWVLVWSIADYEEGLGLLLNVSSSYVELSQLPDNHTVLFKEWNMFTDKSCVNYAINMTVDDAANHTMHVVSGTVENNGVVSPYNESGEVDFYKTCSDCLMFVYQAAEGRFLLNYRSDGHHHDLDQMKANQAEHHKHAKCLGFNNNHPFVYDGAADFCHKKSSPEVKVEPTHVPDH